MDETVLLVDDDAKLRKLLGEYLEGYGIRVLTLEDGSEVLKTIRMKSPDIVILDIMLPQRDGLDILKDIRTEYSLPVIMLTAKGEDADRIVGLELGADDYVPKPFNPRELLARDKGRVEKTRPQRCPDDRERKRYAYQVWRPGSQQGKTDADGRQGGNGAFLDRVQSNGGAHVTSQYRAEPRPTHESCQG